MELLKFIQIPNYFQPSWRAKRMKKTSVVSIYNIVDGILKGKLSSLTEDSSSETNTQRHAQSVLQTHPGKRNDLVTSYGV